MFIWFFQVVVGDDEIEKLQIKLLCGQKTLRYFFYELFFIFGESFPFFLFFPEILVNLLDRIDLILQFGSKVEVILPIVLRKDFGIAVVRKVGIVLLSLFVLFDNAEVYVCVLVMIVGLNVETGLRMQVE